MKNAAKALLPMLACAFCLVIAPGINCTKQSAAEAAKELANTLTDEMNFDNGTVVKGTAPQTSTGAPPTTKVTANSILIAGEKFVVTVETNFTLFQGQTGAVVYVTKSYGPGDAGQDSGQAMTADSYISVKATPTVGTGGSTMVLTGTLGTNEKVLREGFTLMVGMFDDRGVGGYKPWLVTIDSGKCSEPAICDKVCPVFNKCGDGGASDCMKDCPTMAPRFMEISYSKVDECANEIRGCKDQGPLLWMTCLYKDCPTDAKLAFCTRKNACNKEMTVKACMDDQTELYSKWLAGNCTCMTYLNDYKKCLDGIPCTEFLANSDKKCTSYLAPMPPMSDKDGGTSIPTNDASVSECSSGESFCEGSTAVNCISGKFSRRDCAQEGMRCVISGGAADCSLD